MNKRFGISKVTVIALSSRTYSLSHKGKSIFWRQFKNLKASNDYLFHLQSFFFLVKHLQSFFPYNKKFLLGNLSLAPCGQEFEDGLDVHTLKLHQWHLTRVELTLHPTELLLYHFVYQQFWNPFLPSHFLNPEKQVISMNSTQPEKSLHKLKKKVNQLTDVSVIIR